MSVFTQVFLCGSFVDNLITKARAIAEFGSATALARELGITAQAVQQWPDGPIPRLRQYELRDRYPGRFDGAALASDSGQEVAQL